MINIQRFLVIQKFSRGLRIDYKSDTSLSQRLKALQKNVNTLALVFLALYPNKLIAKNEFNRAADLLNHVFISFCKKCSSKPTFL